MHSRRISVVPLVAALLLSGCFSPDPPLLTTPLPGGYTFQSNGGQYGYIAAPEGRRLSSWFGIREDDREFWCGAFGWAGPMVVCRYEEEDGHTLIDAGFFVFDTADANVTIAVDEAAALVLLRSRGVDAMPTLKRRFFLSTRSR